MISEKHKASRQGAAILRGMKAQKKRCPYGKTPDICEKGECKYWSTLNSKCMYESSNGDPGLWM